MKVSVIAPVKNEVDFIGYSIMAVLPHIHEIVYAVGACDDGTLDLLRHIKEKYAKDKLKILEDHAYEFNPMDMAAYNRAFNDCIDASTGDACWFLHPDMVVTNPDAIEALTEGPVAWWTHITSYANDFSTRIVKGRGDRWKNIHAKKFGLHYFGGYGSQNEDFYHRDITGTEYKHYGAAFDEYPFEVADSEIRINHYCELKAHRRRLEKMKLCLKTQHPELPDELITSLAARHPRVTLKTAATQFGHFVFARSEDETPPVFDQYREEFESFKKEVVYG